MKKARIYYNWWGNANIKNGLWVLISPDGEVEDYGSKESLIKEAEINEWKYQVERWHRKQRGKMTIMLNN